MERKMFKQPKTEVWRGEDGLLYIAQDVDCNYSDVPSIVSIDPLFLPTLVKWLQELLQEAE